jgi:hypothetical protein
MRRGRTSPRPAGMDAAGAAAGVGHGSLVPMHTTGSIIIT